MDTENRLPESASVFPLTGRDNAFAISAVVVSVFTAIFGIFGGFALGYLLSAALMLILFGIYFAKGGKPSFFSVLCGLLALANTAIFICTTNGSVRFFGVQIGFLLALACFDGLANGKTAGNRQTAHLYIKAISTIGGIAMSVRSLFSGVDGGNKKKFGKMMLGIACAFPVLIIVLPLLIASDEAFKGMMSQIFDDAFATIFKTIFGLSMSFLVVSYGLCLRFGRTCKQRESTFKGIENTYIISFLSVISVCYLLYLFSQLAYFFSAFKGFLPEEGITYAQYARKGFGEMCVIAVINLALTFTAMLLARKREGKVCIAIKLLATFIGLFTLVIIATAISKMFLYIDEYGMTVRRVTTSAFMVFLAVVFISVILRIYIRKINVVKTALLTAGCVVLILGTVNVNHLCARYNYESYLSGKLKSVDVEAIYNLGDEGIPYITKLAEHKDPAVAKEAKFYLRRAFRYDYFDNQISVDTLVAENLQKNEKNSKFSRFSLPRAAAYESLYAYLEEHPEFGK